MKRIICEAPNTLTMAALTEEQKEGLKNVMAQFKLPMPGTKYFDGKVIIDGTVQDNFQESAITDLGLPLTVVGLYSWDGSNGLVAEVELNTERFMKFLPDIDLYDEEGEVIGTREPEEKVPHNWSGWPQIQLNNE